MNSDLANAAFLPLTATSTLGYLDFSSSAAVQTIVLDAGVWQAIVVGTGEAMLRTDNTTPSFPATTATATGILVAPGASPTFRGSATEKCIARAAGIKVYFQRVVPS